MYKSNTPQIEIRPIAALRAYAGTARIHPPAQRRKLATLLRRHGQLTPVLVDDVNEIIDGHLVVEALKAIGETEVRVLVIANRDKADIQAIRLALNRLPQDSKWDQPRLRAEFEDLLSLGYELDLTGFDAIEIDATFSIDEPGAGELEDAPPEPAADGRAVSRPGDLILLGEHRVLCGDARCPSTIARLMGGSCARMAFLDVPYNCKISGFVTSGAHREFAMASGEMSGAEFVAFLHDALDAASQGLVDGAILYVCIDWRGLTPIAVAAAKAGLSQLNLIVWTKTNAGMGTFYRSQHELIPVFKKGTAPHTNNFELGQKGRSRSNVWSYRGMNAFAADRDALLGSHPTVKPVALVRDAIKDVSRRGEIVIDTFLGSGTTLIAAEETGRRCFGMELDPLYVDVIVRRWQAHTGRPAAFEGGELFDDRAAGLSRASVPAALPAPPLLLADLRPEAGAGR